MTNRHICEMDGITVLPLAGNPPPQYINIFVQKFERYFKSNFPSDRDTGLEPLVTSVNSFEEKISYTSLVLLHRLKCRLPSTQGLLAHRLFASAYMIASKNIYGSARSNMFWVDTFDRRFSLQELNEMEREMVAWLDGDIDVDDEILENFRTAVDRDFGQERKEYPVYPYSMVSRRAVMASDSIGSDSLSGEPKFVIQRNPTCSEVMVF